MNKRIIKILFTAEDDICSHLGITYIATSSQDFISELMKYKCPIRVIEYLDNNVHQYAYIEFDVKQPDLIVDFINEHKKLYESLSIPFRILTEPKEYIAYTPHLDMYGNMISNTTK